MNNESNLKIICGHVLDELAKLPDESVHCCVTSPPYWGLRDYKLPAVTWPTGWTGQHGLEPTFDLFVEHEVLIFREVRRVLRDDGTLWLNLGDSYCSTDKWGGGKSGNSGKHTVTENGEVPSWACRAKRDAIPGLKPKDLVGIPWRVALALQADGWYLRCDVIWQKLNPMPESVTDRPTKSHEYIFLMAKSESYFYDHEAIKDPVTNGAHSRKANGANSRMVKERMIGREDSKPNPSRSNIPGVTPKSAQVGIGIKANESFHEAGGLLVANRNKRSVWTVATAPFKGAHFATFPPALITPCILAGTSAKGCCAKCGAPWERTLHVDYIKNRPSAGNDLRSRNEDRATQARGHGGWRGNNLLRDSKTTGWIPTCKCECAEVVPCTVLDPFGGSLTTAQVSLDNGRACVIIELNPEYVEMGKDRLGLFQTQSVSI